MSCLSADSPSFGRRPMRAGPCIPNRRSTECVRGTRFYVSALGLRGMFDAPLWKFHALHRAADDKDPMVVRVFLGRHEESGTVGRVVERRAGQHLAVEEGHSNRPAW